MSRVPSVFGAGLHSPGMMPIGVYKDSEKDAVVVLQQTKALFVLSSRDRFQNASVSYASNNVAYNASPWNDFRLQKPAALMNAFAKRISVTELNFPWNIPNIVEDNNEFWIRRTDNATIFNIGIAPGFYLPSEIVTSVNIALAAAGFAAPPPTLAYDVQTQQYIFDSGIATEELTLYPADPTTTISPVDYSLGRPSMLYTLGVAYDQLYLANPTRFVRGNPASSLYTEYVDICSTKLSTFAEIQDGSSSNINKTSMICRVYLADEVSVTTVEPIGTRPFHIHRQFSTPKIFQWDPTAFIDWLDVQVYDMYGNLVPLPQYVAAGAAGVKSGSYPDFQITLLASEA